MYTINLEKCNEFELDYITEKFDTIRVTYDDTDMLLMDVAKVEDCKMDIEGNVYYPYQFIVEAETNTSKPVDYELLCTKAEMLSKWIKEENIA